MDLFGGVDPGSMLVGLVALWFSIRESRRNGSAVVRRLEANAGSQQCVDKNNGRPFSTFTVMVKNIGIPLHEVTAHVVFYLEGRESGEIELLIVGEKRAEFARGMVAEFRYESFRFGEWGPKMLSKLMNPIGQRAKVVIKSHGLVAKEFYAYGLRERVIRKWNDVIWAIGGFLVKRFPKHHLLLMRMTALFSLSWQLENLARDSKCDIPHLTGGGPNCP